LATFYFDSILCARESGITAPISEFLLSYCYSELRWNPSQAGSKLVVEVNMQTKSSHGPTAIASYGHSIALALEKRGVDPKVIFQQAGVSLQTSLDPMLRISNEEVGRLFKFATQATGDPYLGLYVGKMIKPASLHALGLGLLVSSSLRGFYQRISNYYHLVSNNADFQFYDRDGESVLQATNVLESVCHESREAFCVAMVRIMRSLYQHELNPLWVNLMSPCPDAGAQPYLDFFKCPVNFNCEDMRIALDSSIMDCPLPGASRELAQYNDQIAMRYLEKLDKANLVNRVRSLIISELASGTISKQSIADQLHMSPRSLQLKLAAKDTTFQDTLDMTRQTLAQGYIEQSTLTITEIAYLLGFADSSNFTRAFKRWTGQSPSKFREKYEHTSD
jgi:AraC-like DNA-binding protein